MSEAGRREPPPPGSGPAGPPRAAAVLRALLAPLERLCDRLYGSRWNPLHQSGALAVLFFLVALATGLYLFLFYRIADPHGSVARIHGELFLGSWVRSLHRYAADLAMVAIVLHLVRKLVQGHTWGPRALAWTSGVVLAGIVLVCGWSGLVLVWDTQGLLVASQGARLFDLLPIFSEPIRRSFSGEAPVPSSFFFMNLFLHVATPLALAGGLWLHVSRVARPALLPPRPLRRAALALLALFAALWPVALAPAADLRALPGRIDLDVFFAFWLPVARRVPPAVQLGLWVLAFAVLVAMPRLWRPRRAVNVSWVDEHRCTGCETCYHDCPYEAISMVPRSWGKQSSPLVAHVDPDRCVGCGICAGSCAPMGVGPWQRTGRDQLVSAGGFVDRLRPDGREVVVVGCRATLGGRPELLAAEGVTLYPVACAGSVHTSVVELLLRRGVGGVLLLSCPPRDCRFREGPKWLEQRLFHGREAELPERVDRRRVAHVSLSLHEAAAARAAVEQLRRQVAALAVVAETRVDLEAECEVPDPVEAGRGG